MLKPVNRHLQIVVPPPPGPTTASGIVLPEDFKPTEEKHVVVKVVSWAQDVRFKEELNVGTEIIVDKSMIEEINVKNETINLVLDNYIVGILSE